MLIDQAVPRHNQTTDYTPKQGIYDQGYIDFLSGLDQQELMGYAGQPGVMGGIPTDYATIQTFRNTYGRNPTATEFALFGPMGVQAGQAIAGAKYAEENTPAAIYARQQQEWQKTAPQHYEQVSGIIKSLLGRDPSQEELSHYGMLLSSGQADPYQIQQFLMASPEYQNAQDVKFRGGLDTELQNYDTQFFNRAKQGIAQQYAMMGRSTSPALDVALTDLAAQLNEKRGQYLAGLSAQQYGGNKTAATTDYQKQLDELTQRQNQNTAGLYNNVQSVLGRGREISDYNRQSQDWMNAMNKYGPQGPGTLDYLNTAFNGVNAIANVGKTAAMF